MAIKAVIFDMDGVIHRGDRAIAGVACALENIGKAGIAVFFMTNNSSQNRKNYAKKLAGFGIKTSEKMIYTSASGTVAWARARNVKTAYVIGEYGLKDELETAGIMIVENGFADAVIVGLDRKFTYEKIDIGMQAITNGALFIATNPDGSYPRENDFGPGAGAMVAAVRVACGKTPDYIAGKPTTHLIENLLSDWKIRKNEAVFIGDRLDTDIKCAKNAGLKSILVLSGVAKHEHAKASKKEDRPDLILKSAADITPEILQSL